MRNSFSLDFPGLPGFQGSFGLHDIPVVDPGVSEFVDCRFHGLNFTHSGLDHDLFIDAVVIAFCVSFDLVKTNGDRGHRPDCVHKDLVVLRGSGQLRDIELRKGFAKRLCQVKHLCNFKMGDGNFDFFHDRISAGIPDGGSCMRVCHLALSLFLIRGRNDNGDPLLSPADLAMEFLLPGPI